MIDVILDNNWAIIVNIYPVYAAIFDQTIDGSSSGLQAAPCYQILESPLDGESEPDIEG